MNFVGKFKKYKERGSIIMRNRMFKIIACLVGVLILLLATDALLAKVVTKKAIVVIAKIFDVAIMVCVIALILNAIFSPTVTHEECINFFYISPYYGCSLPILSTIREMVPWPVFLIIYFLGFIIISFIIYLIYLGIRQLSRLIVKKKQLKQ